jgi:cystathionine beta-lyase/cystathionine gamma-synthase
MGFSGMLSLRIRGGLEETKVFLKSLKVINLNLNLSLVIIMINYPFVKRYLV